MSSFPNESPHPAYDGHAGHPYPSNGQDGSAQPSPDRGAQGSPDARARPSAEQATPQSQASSQQSQSQQQSQQQQQQQQPHPHPYQHHYMGPPPGYAPPPYGAGRYPGPPDGRPDGSGHPQMVPVHAVYPYPPPNWPSMALDPYGRPYPAPPPGGASAERSTLIPMGRAPAYPLRRYDGEGGMMPQSPGSERGSEKGARKGAAGAGGEDGEEGEKKPAKKTEIACDFCRARKLKCDGLRPQCGQCQQRDQICAYKPGPPNRRGPGRKNRVSVDTNGMSASPGSGAPRPKRKRVEEMGRGREEEMVHMHGPPHGMMPPGMMGPPPPGMMMYPPPPQS